MGLLSRLLERRSTLADPSQWLLDAFTTTPTASGLSVTHDTALSVPAVYAAVARISQTVAQVPLKVFRRLPDGGKVPEEQHRVYGLLHDQPNGEMDSFVFRETLQGHLCLWGNAYAEIQRDQAGRVVALWPLIPSQMTLYRGADRALRYLYRLPSGEEIKWTREPGEPAPILHLRAYSHDGIIGRSVITEAREALGLALATQENAARFFGNGSSPGGVIQGPHEMNGETHQRLKRSWESAHKGLTNAHRVAILEHGFEWKAVGVPPQDAQFIEQRKFQVTEIARLFGIPPHMLGDMERATFSNIEQQSLEFVIYAMMPHYVRWESAIKRDILGGRRAGPYFPKFVVEGLLRGDIQTRYAAYAVGRQWGWLSANDVRDKEDMNRIKGEAADAYMTPLNMASGEEAGVRLAKLEAQEQARMLAVVGGQVN